MKKRLNKQSFIISLFPSTTTILIFLFYISFFILFFFLLDKKTSNGFGIREILFSLGSTIFIVALMVWINDFMKRNRYLGLILGIFGTVSLISGLFLKYYGKYTISFATIGSVFAIVYFVYYFFKYKDKVI